MKNKNTELEKKIQELYEIAKINKRFVMIPLFEDGLFLTADRYGKNIYEDTLEKTVEWEKSCASAKEQKAKKKINMHSY